MLVILLQAQSTPEWVLFLGRFHPLLVHLPIGILIIAALIEFFARTPKLQALREANNFVLFWGALTATFACVLGYLLSQSGGYDEDALDTHAWLGYAVAGTAWLAYILKRSQTSVIHKVYVPVFTASVLLIFAAGHYGGNLTHGSDYLTQYMPNPLRSVAGLPPRKEKSEAKKITDINQALVYQDLVQPALDQTCVSCHNAEKQKGDLRMDTPELLRKGGENGPIFIAGNAETSEMLKRIHLPLEDDDHMPPKGKPQPSDQQIALLTWWINQGAPFDKKVADLKVSDEIKPVLASFTQGATPAVEDGSRPAAILVANVPKADAKAIEALRQQSVIVLPVAQDNNLLEVSFVNAKSFNDTQVVLLTPVAQQTVWLKLGRTQIGDKTIAELSKFKNLNRLHLEFTNVTDAGLKNLKSAQSLQYLNLIGTAITDQGLKELGTLKTLRTLYLWQTKVTPQGVADLQKALPDTEINTGMEEQGPAASVQKLVSQQN
jgi:uncharacterized membrane protein/mono/diheme cytochrome c family protein